MPNSTNYSTTSPSSTSYTTYPITLNGKTMNDTTVLMNDTTYTLNDQQFQSKSTDWAVSTTPIVGTAGTMMGFPFGMTYAS